MMETFPFKTGLLCLCMAICVVTSGSTKGVGPSHYKDNPIWNLEVMFKGPRAEIELVNNIPTKTKKKLLLSLAKTHDVNNDDVIDRDELANWFRESHSIHDEYDVIQLTGDNDRNGDGKVSLGELLASQHKGQTDKSIAKLEKKQAKGKKLSKDDQELVRMAGENKKRFNGADVNQDGFLDHAEMMRLTFPGRYPEMETIELDIAMEFGDMDKDGFISLKELMIEDPTESQRAEVEEELRNLDTDGDGKLTREEMRPYLVPVVGSVDAMAESLVKEVDKDGDGRMAMAEIGKNDRAFTFNSLLDFGRFLFFIRYDGDVTAKTEGGEGEEDDAAEVDLEEIDPVEELDIGERLDDKEVTVTGFDTDNTDNHVGELGNEQDESNYKSKGDDESTIKDEL